MKPLVVRKPEADVLAKLSDKDRLILIRFFVRLMKEAQGMESLRTERGRSCVLKYLAKGIGDKLNRVGNETKEEGIPKWE